MKTCTTCGNEIQDAVWTCPFCESSQSGGVARSSRRRRAAAVTTLNVKDGLPVVDDALQRMEAGIATARHTGVAVVRVVHGYGSSGKGGQIKQAIPGRLTAMQSRGLIKGFVSGENYSRQTDAGLDLLSRCPELKQSYRQDANNTGITFVTL